MGGVACKMGSRMISDGGATGRSRPIPAFRRSGLFDGGEQLFRKLVHNSLVIHEFPNYLSR
jgi:hypothetical protein